MYVWIKLIKDSNSGGRGMHALKKAARGVETFLGYRVGYMFLAYSKQRGWVKLTLISESNTGG